MTSNGKMYTIVMEKLSFEPRLDSSKYYDINTR